MVLGVRGAVFEGGVVKRIGVVGRGVIGCLSAEGNPSDGRPCPEGFLASVAKDAGPGSLSTESMEAVSEVTSFCGTSGVSEGAVNEVAVRQ